MLLKITPKQRKKSYAHLQISKQILLGKFAESKCRYMAQYSNFREKTEPVWLKGRYAPKGKGANSGIVQRRNMLKLQYLRAASYYALWDLSYGITSRDFVCQSPNQKPQIFLRLCSLGAYRPQSPGKER